MERRILGAAEGNPFFLEELVRSLVDAGALVHDEHGGWRFDHDAPLEVPADGREGHPGAHRPARARLHESLMAASVLGRQFGLPLLEAVVGPRNGAVQDVAADCSVSTWCARRAAGPSPSTASSTR